MLGKARENYLRRPSVTFRLVVAESPGSSRRAKCRSFHRSCKLFTCQIFYKIIFQISCITDTKMCFFFNWSSTWIYVVVFIVVKFARTTCNGRTNIASIDSTDDNKRLTFYYYSLMSRPKKCPVRRAFCTFCLAARRLERESKRKINEERGIALSIFCTRSN